MTNQNNAAQAQRDRYHILKTDPEVFQAVLSGAKTFEIRLNDRGYAVGDVLGLRETKHTGAEMRAGAPLVYTGRECQRFVSHVLTGYGLADGWCCLSFRLPHAGGASAPVAEQKPIKLSDDVLHFLKEGVENATQCEESDVDQEFADQLLLLMHTPLYTEPPPKQREVDWGPLVVAPVADERAHGPILKKARNALALTLATAQQFEKQASRGTGGRRGGPVFEKARAAIDAIDAALASAPVAGEAQPLGYVRKGREWPNQCYYPSSHKPTDIHNWTPVFDHAAPQPSGDAGIAASDHERNAALEALEAAQRFIRNGIEFGYIRMPDADTPDPAHRTPGLIDAAIRSLKSQADKDGGQQRAGDVSAEAHKAALLEVERVGIELAARLHEAAMSLETISQIAGRPGKDMETMDDVRGYAHSRARAARAALSATQAEQGERDA